jgi:hypothetical protein
MSVFFEASGSSLTALAMMLDADARVEGSVTLRRAIRYLEDASALNPAWRQRLRWALRSEGGNAEKPPEPFGGPPSLRLRPRGHFEL